MQHWSFSIDDVHVQVSTHADEPGVYDLRWTTDGRPQSMTAAHADRSPMNQAQLQEAVHTLLTAAAAPAPAPQRTTGLVREWRDEEGWGVIDSPQTPGGCWAHFSSVRVTGYASLVPGQLVDLEWEAPGQDGFDYRAVAAWPVGQARVDPVVDTDSGAYTSALHLTFDPPGPAPITSAPDGSPAPAFLAAIPSATDSSLCRRRITTSTAAFGQRWRAQRIVATTG